MANNQQLQFAETIRAYVTNIGNGRAYEQQRLTLSSSMKLALKRHAADSDSDDEIRTHTNRGNKLKRNARHVQQNHLDDTGGLAYRKKIKHAGYTRTVISTNPPLLDEDGDPYSPVSSGDEAERFAEPAEENPFGDVRIEHLLRPLTSPAELPDHPSLSVAYKSKALTQMAEEALDMLRRERASLWKAKRMLQRFRGDADWAPSSTFETDDDDLLLGVGGSLADRRPIGNLSLDRHLALEPPNEPAHNEEPSKALLGAASADGDAMEGVEAIDMAFGSTEGPAVDDSSKDGTRQDVAQDQVMGEQTTDQDSETRTADGEGNAEQALNPALADLADRDAASETASNSNGTSTHAMTTRARARSPAERSDGIPSPSPSDSASVPAINRWFVPPASCLADRDMGLPPHEAEDTRKLLMLYVQKQEHIVRSLNTLCMGLQKADRLRTYVYRICEAEGHLVPDGKGNMITEMSDGEDWYNVADYSLQAWELKDGHLEKGKDEVEDVEEEGKRRPGRGRRVNRM